MMDEKHTVVCMSGNGKPILRLRTAEFDKLARAILGEQTNGQLAARLGVSAAHFSQIRTGGRNPGSGFIAKVMSLMPHVKLEQIFELVEDEERVA